jgi:hypothetical protein
MRVFEISLGKVNGAMRQQTEIQGMNLVAATTTEVGKRSRTKIAGHEVIVDCISCWKFCLAHACKDIIRSQPLQRSRGAGDTFAR